MEFFTELLVIYLFLFIGYLIQVPIHEGGHLLFGLLTGYRFVSFRVGSFTLITQNGKLTRKCFRIPGTLGQCLMDPPEPIDDKFPATLYHLGGSLLNLIVSAILFGIAALLWMSGLTAGVPPFFLVGAIGVLLALSNLLPIKMSGVATDGYNALKMGKDPLADRSFWLQLRINALQTAGMRLRDMPEEYFTLPTDADLSNVHITSWAYFRFCYLFDLREFTAAEDFARPFLTKESKLLGIYQNELRCDLLFLMLLAAAPREEIDGLYTMELQKYVKATACYPSRQRLLYAYAKLILNDQAACQTALEQFQKVSKTHPFPGEVAGEAELVALVDGQRLGSPSPQGRL